MKRIFVLTIASLLGACNSDSKQDVETTKAVVADSVQYQNTVTSDTSAGKTTVVTQPGKVEEHKETVARERHTSTSAPVAKPATTTTTSTTTTSTSTTAPAATVTTSTTTPITETPTVTPEKKGMSHSAKDAIIGGASGAVGGAIISHKKGKGAIIGGVLGAGAGYILGKHQDKKDTTR